jgi:hypothetical protein
MTVNVAVVPTEFVRLCGWTVMAGGTAGCVTVKVATVLVTEPATFATRTL